jgi:Type II CAAX prenyl endopeptidase Rce1-like
MAMLMGICLHFVYQTTRSLWLSILLHFLNNSLSVVQLRFSTLDALDNRPEDFVPLFAASALFVAAIGYALYQSRARLAPAKPGAVYQWRPDFPGVEHPPADSGTIVVHPRLTYLAVIGVVCGLLAFCVSCCLAYQKLAAPAGS